MRTKGFANSWCQASGKLIFCKPKTNTRIQFPLCLGKNQQISICGPHIRAFGLHVCTWLYTFIKHLSRFNIGLTFFSKSISSVRCFQHKIVCIIQKKKKKKKKNGLNLFRCQNDTMKKLSKSTVDVTVKKSVDTVPKHTRTHTYPYM